MENVVCVPNGCIYDGLHLNNSAKFNLLLNQLSLGRFYAIRDKNAGINSIENNTTIRQLIVYVLLKQDNNYFIYQRSAGTGEGRLAGKYALPGGHMNAFSESFVSDIQLDTLRELTEELQFIPRGIHKAFPSPNGEKLNMKIAGILQCSCDEEANLVQLVHTGIIAFVNIDKDFEIQLKESSKMQNLTKINSSNYLEYIDKSEKWLQIILPWLPQIL